MDTHRCHRTCSDCLMDRLEMKRPKPRRRASRTLLTLSAVLFLCANFLPVVNAVCPSGCKCDDENLHVICVDANLDIVPITLNPSVEKIILRSNRIKTVDHGISFYLELVHIDLSHNHLVKIQAYSFSKQTKLVQLNLSNNKISSLSNRTFGGFGSGNKEGLPLLAVLNLHDNLLEELEPGVFSYTPNIEELDLSQNKIKELNPNVTDGLSKLRVLKLNSNELNQVPPIFTKNSESPLLGGFGGMLHLAELFLGNNPIDKIGNDAFSGLKNLGTLDLRECHLSSIEPNAFHGLTSLRKLVLIDNDLRTVPSPQTLAPLAQLEVLKIGRNPISRIENMAFASLKKVKVIEMSGAPDLAFVAQDAFVSNLDLETVEISSAKKLGVLPPKLFKGISSLRNLSLKENSLGNVPEELASWQSLRSLRLEGNPFHCSCDLLWLRDLLQLDRFRNSSFLVLCSEPKELIERKVSALSDKEMNCYLNSPMQKTVLGVSLGVAILVLIIFFYLMYRYHDKIKNMCKRKCFGRSNRSSRKSHRSSTPSTVKASELDHTNNLKSSFLSHSSAYPYSDEEYAIRTSLISPPPIPSSGPPGSYSLRHPSHMMHPQTHPSLHRNSMAGVGPPGNGYSGIHSLGGPHHPHNYPQHSSAHSPYPSEYESVPINSLGLYPTTHHHGGGGWGGGPLTSLSRGGGQDFNNHMSTLQAPMHYNPHQQVVKPIPITEL